MLTVTGNKVQLIDLMCEDMAFHKDYFSQHKLVLTVSNPVHVEINRGVVIKRQDMKTTQEEADIMIVQQVAEVKATKVLVVADDTDIVVLLLHFCCQCDIPASTSVLMVSPIRGRAVIDINATVDLPRDIIPDLLTAHGLTVATYFGNGKAAALRILASGVHALTYVGDTSRILSEITAQATPFILACCGHTKCTSLTGGTPENVCKQSGPECGGAPKLASLPPTNVAFNENVAHSLSGGSMEEGTATRSTGNWHNNFWLVAGRSIQNSYPDNTSQWHPAAPDDLLKLVRCSCSSETPCKTQRCGCSRASLACSMFCASQGGQGCFNERTRQGKVFRQTTMTKMNRCISTEPGMGSKQPVWELFNTVVMTTINLKLIHHCYWIYCSQFCMPRKCEERAIHWSCLY